MNSVYCVSEINVSSPCFFLLNILFPASDEVDGLETDDGINQNNISGTKKPFGDALFTNIKTKPEGSGGEENRVEILKINV